MTIAHTSLLREDAGTPALAAATKTLSVPEASTSEVNIDPLAKAPKITVTLTRSEATKTSPIVKTLTATNVRKASLS